MQISQKGQDFIAGFEAEILKVYNDPVGLPTAGIGHLLTGDEQKLFPVGTPITREQSRAWWAKDLAAHARPVDVLVYTSLTQNQYDALVSFTFNLGEGKLRKILPLINARKFKTAAAKMLLYVWARDRKGRLVKLPGLVRRRAAEARMLLS